jgi:predicted TIM-barrel fold metal-dependent hydrolase
VIDFHTHAPAWHTGTWLAGAPFTVGQLIEMMDANDLEACVVLSHDGLFAPSVRANDELADFVAGAPDRLFALGTVNPRQPDAAEETVRCLRELDMRGLKLHPWLQGFSLHEPALASVCEALVEHEGMLLFHDGTPPYSTALQIAALARQHPQLPVILGHGGLHDTWREALVATQETPNLYHCLSGTPPYAARQVVMRAPVDRLLFGSDSGLSSVPDQPYARARMREVAELGLPPDRLEAMLTTNPRRLLRFPPEGRAA